MKKEFRIDWNRRIKKSEGQIEGEFNDDDVDVELNLLKKKTNE